MGRRVVPLQMDVTISPRPIAAIDTAIAELGGIDILVNNVGGGVEAWAPDVTEADFDATVDAQRQVELLHRPEGRSVT